MSRLLYVPIIGAIVLMFGCWRQPSEEAGDGCALGWSLSLPPCVGVWDCSSSGASAALLARETHGMLGGERTAQRRVRTNFSPRL